MEDASMVVMATIEPHDMLFATTGDYENDSLLLEYLPLCPVHNRTAKSNYNLAVEEVKYITYGILMPSICALGIVGNVLNLIVLNQANMKGTAYIYMRDVYFSVDGQFGTIFQSYDRLESIWAQKFIRFSGPPNASAKPLVIAGAESAMRIVGYSAAALMAIIVAIPFTVRILVHHEVGEWTNFYQAFFHTYLELYLGNSCLGIGVMMLVALTLERFMAVCHPEKSRILNGSKRAHFIIASIPICTLVVYGPHLFRSTLYQCLSSHGISIYQKSANKAFLTSIFFRIYVWLQAIVFRLGPTILLAYLNLRIIVAYRRTCANRRRMTGKASRDDSKKFAEESRIMMLLGSTSILFFVCVTPMVILSVVINESLIRSGSLAFHIFRATANFLEVANYSITFYIYCLFSREFRNTFLGLFKGKESQGSLVPTGGGQKVSGGRQRESTPLEAGGAGGSTPLL